MKYKISVIIPTYNAKDCLMTAVNSVINQTFGFENIELILVDDSSNDGTQELIQKLSNKYSNILPIFNKENSGSPSKPRNIGIKNASADYIMFMDNDDYYSLDFCEVIYSNAIKYDVDIVSCRNYDFYDDGRDKSIFKSILDKKDKFVKLDNIDEDPQFLTTTSILIWNKIYRKSLILDNDIKFPSGNLYEDDLFNIQAYIKAKGIVFLNDYYGYNYQIRVAGEEKSISQDFKKENLLKFKGGLTKVFNVLIKENKHYPSFEAELLAGFMKWIFFTNDSIENKLNIFKEVKPFYKRYSLFARITFISIFFNIAINIGIKIIYNSQFKIMLKIYNIILR